MCIRFRDYLKKYGLRFAVALACGILSCVLLALGPQLLGDITTHIFSGILAKLNGTGAMNLEAIAEILRLLTGVYFCFASDYFRLDIRRDFGRSYLPFAGECAGKTAHTAAFLF